MTHPIWLAVGVVLAVRIALDILTVLGVTF